MKGTKNSAGRTSTEISPISLAAELGVLTTIGAPPDQIDGSEAISNASPPVRTAMVSMVRDAERLTTAAVNTGVTGVQLVGDMTPILTSFTSSLVACSHAGYQPPWFSPQELVG